MKFTPHQIQKQGSNSNEVISNSSKKFGEGFTHLHLHSHYSLLDGLTKISDLVNRCAELKMEALALTDHGSMYGAVEFYKKAKQKNIKPILGSEMYVAPRRMQDKELRLDEKPFHLILLVKNKTGYQNLIQLTTQAYLEGFYYKPRIDKDLLKKHNDGLIGLSACLAGEISRAIISGDLPKAEKVALEYQEIFGPGNFYLELEHHPGLAQQEKVNQALLAISKKHKIPVVAAYDVHYLKPEDSQAQDILMAVQTGAKMEDEERLTMKHDDFSLQPPEQMMEWFKDIPEAITNTQKIVEQCNFELELGKIQLPYFEVPENKTPENYLKELCEQGLRRRYDNVSKGSSASKKILERLEYELSVIQQTGFASYFLIVQDFVNWAKENKIIVGPGRGSVAGSLAAYLLNITDLDPLKYDLLFERFLNPERISMPDIDLDFADARRDEVIDYVRRKYGRDHVAQIITFGTMASRAAVRDTGRAMGYAYNLCDQVAKMIPFGLPLERALHESSELNHIYHTDKEVKKLIDIALKLEGVARHASTHACGLVITKEPLNKIVPLQHPTQNDEAIVTQYEMHAIEDLGLLKIDLLGLKNLTIIENTLKIAAKTQEKQIDISHLPLNDSKTFQLLQEGRTTGVFQLESAGMKRYLKELKPTVFEDIIAMVALYRPGPMEFISDFINRKHGRKQIAYLHPQLESILKNTYGIAVYQEQVMEIASKLAGFTLSEADTLRKAVGKKIKKLLDEQHDKMIEGMLRNKIPQATAEKIWQFIKPFASYGFNRAHAACYAMIGYETAYLKAHFPTELMCALMTSEQNDIERIAILVDECRQMKIEVLPPDINESLENFTVIKNGFIRFGLIAIKNVGANVVAAIVQEKKQNGLYQSISEFIERVQNKDLNKKSLESLIKCGAIDKLGERNQLLANLETLLSFGREMQASKNNRQISLFSNLNDKTSKNGFSPQLKFRSAPPASKTECLAWEKDLLGLYISEHPIKEFQQILQKTALLPSQVSAKLVGRNVKVAGIISKIKKIITRSGKPMLFVTLEDDKSKIEVLVFPSTLERTAFFWQEDKIAIVSGRLDDKDGDLKILCEEAQELNQNHLNNYR